MDWNEIIKSHHSPGYGFGKHYLTLYSIVRGLNARNCFEFGIGMSTRVLLFALEATGGMLTSCAVHTPEESGIAKQDVLAWEGRWRFIRGRSEKVLTNHNMPMGLDFVLHDGSHDFAVLKGDLKMIQPRMKQNGLILIHDVCHEYENMLTIVRQFVKRYSYELCVLPYGYGLAVVRVSRPTPNGSIFVRERKEKKDHQPKVQEKRREREAINSVILNRLRVLDKDNPVVVHVGGFNGLRDVGISMCIPDAVIHTIEPCFQNYEWLLRYTEGYDNIIPYQVAISGQEGNVVLYVPQNESLEECKLPTQGASLIDIPEKREKEESAISEETVYAVTLDGFCKAHSIGRIDWLTMNCEGAEYQVFAPGGSMRFLDRTNILDISLHGKSRVFNADDITDQKVWIGNMLKQRGFYPVWGVSDGDIRDEEAGHVRQVWFRGEKV